MERLEMKEIRKYKLELVKENGVDYMPKNRVDAPNLVFRALEDIFRMSKQAEEIFVMMTMSTAKVISGAFEVSRGTLNTACVSPREVFKRAILINAESIIIAHNHPSGSLSPSRGDFNLTRRLVECGKILDINVIDHLIVGDDDYYSMKEHGDM